MSSSVAQPSQPADAAAAKAAAQSAAPPLSPTRSAQFAAFDAQARHQGRRPDFAETTLLTGHGQAMPLPASTGLAAARVTPGEREASGERPADQQDPGAPLQQVGPYRLQQRLGRGGMGVVYRAVDERDGRALAIKFLHASMREDAESRASFLREARAARGLAHPNIVAVHEVGEAFGRPYIVMELVEGLPLSRMLERSGALPLGRALRIGLQLAEALAYAHERGVVHRDIKPGNILLLRDGHTIKVSDFGIADFDGAPQEEPGNAVLLGTPQYMSPEQTRGEAVDGRSDLFSAGVVLYQMLGGERPFRGEDLLTLAHRIATEPAPPLQQLRPELPLSVQRLVERCLAKQPAQRFASGHALAQALRAALKELDAAAGVRPRWAPGPAGWRWLLAGAGLALMLLLWWWPAA